VKTSCEIRTRDGSPHLSLFSIFRCPSPTGSVLLHARRRDTLALGHAHVETTNAVLPGSVFGSCADLCGLLGGDGPAGVLSTLRESRKRRHSHQVLPTLTSQTREGSTGKTPFPVYSAKDSERTLHFGPEDGPRWSTRPRSSEGE
jgi:hypothetical protein